jgi:WD40 repeat protein
LKLLQNGFHLVAGFSDGQINIYDIRTGAFVRALWRHTNRVTDLALVGNNLLASSSIWEDNSDYIQILNLTSPIFMLKFGLRGHKNSVESLKLVSPSVLASASRDRTIKLWNLNTGRIIRTLNGHTQAVLSLELFSSQILASASDDFTIKYWNINTGALLKTIVNPGANIQSLGAVNPIVIGNFLN